MLVLDTSVVVASLNADERRHTDCRELIASANEPLVIPSSTLCEIDHVAGRRFGPSAMPAFLRRIQRGELSIEELGVDDCPE